MLKNKPQAKKAPPCAGGTDILAKCCFVGKIGKRCCINVVENQLHILTNAHPSIALADFVREIKVSTSIWMKNTGLFPSFKGLADGYGSFTCSYMDMGRLVDYVKIQQEHHKKNTFEEEYSSLLMEFGTKVDEMFFP